MVRHLIIITCAFLFSPVFGQKFGTYRIDSRGFSYSFNNKQYPFLPIVVWVDPLSDADRAGLKGGITIFGINQTDFGNLSPSNKITPKMSQEAIVSFMNKLPSGPITIRGGYFNFGVDFVNKISIGAIVPPADSTHPEGVCLSGNCRNGEGYFLFSAWDTQWKIKALRVG
ncbi:MAG: hypothetical protein MUE99_06815 [Chitinophagaceae bacterium]|nr:hypothetical protein [Chitinophagaceae bacterium]